MDAENHGNENQAINLHHRDADDESDSDSYASVIFQPLTDWRGEVNKCNESDNDVQEDKSDDEMFDDESDNDVEKDKTDDEMFDDESDNDVEEDKSDDEMFDDESDNDVEKDKSDDEMFDDEVKDPDYELSDDDFDDDDERVLQGNDVPLAQDSPIGSECPLQGDVSDVPLAQGSPIGSECPLQGDVSDVPLAQGSPIGDTNDVQLPPGSSTGNEWGVANASEGKWAKKHACVYCGKLYPKLPRHLTDKHANEKMVAQTLALPKRSTERDKLWTALRNKGDLKNNLKVIEEQKGKLIPGKRPCSMESNPNDYIPCPHCTAMFLKHSLWRHVKKCKLRNSNEKNRDHQKQGKLLMPVPQNVSDAYKTTILASLEVGTVRQVIASDPLIGQFGQRKFQKCMHRPHQHRQVRQSVRELGRFVVKLRECKPCKNLTDCINPERFNDVVDVVREVCGFNPHAGSFRVPSLAQHIGQSLHACAGILRSNGLKSGDMDLVAKANGFMSLYETDWTTEVGTFALNTVETRRFNKPKAMPLARDIQILNKHIAEQANKSYEELQSVPSITAWRRLNALTLAQLVLFNRRRSGEMERAELTQYLKGTSGCSMHEELLQTLSDVEQHLVKVLDRFEIRGKRGRRVPVLVTSQHKQQIECLLKHRSDVGVRDSNIYLFPRTDDAKTPIRSCDVFKTILFECKEEIKRPEWISSTMLRKHIATMSQLLNLKRNEMDALATFMGHDILVHRAFYRLPEETTQLAKLSKILLQMEKAGNVEAFRGKSLDEINMDEDELLDECADSDDESEQNTPATEQKKKPSVEKAAGNVRTMSSKEKEVPSEKTTRKVHSRKPWRDEEMAAVKENLKKFIDTDTLPGKSDVLEAQRNAPLLKERAWALVKCCVKNIISAKKRKLLKTTC